jgi:hypothetical protein
MDSWVSAGVAAENGAEFIRRDFLPFVPAGHASDCQPRAEFREMCRWNHVRKPVDNLCGDGALPVHPGKHKMLCFCRKIPLDGEADSGIPAIIRVNIVST